MHEAIGFESKLCACVCFTHIHAHTHSIEYTVNVDIYIYVSILTPFRRTHVYSFAHIFTPSKFPYGINKKTKRE